MSSTILDCVIDSTSYLAVIAAASNALGSARQPFLSVCFYLFLPELEATLGGLPVDVVGCMVGTADKKRSVKCSVVALFDPCNCNAVPFTRLVSNFRIDIKMFLGK